MFSWMPDAGSAEVSLFRTNERTEHAIIYKTMKVEEDLEAKCSSWIDQLSSERSGYLKEAKCATKYLSNVWEVQATNLTIPPLKRDPKHFLKISLIILNLPKIRYLSFSLLYSRVGKNTAKFLCW